MRIFRRYIGKMALANSMLVLAALLMMFSFFDLIYELRELSTGNYGFITALSLVGLNLPGHCYELLPVAALIGSLVAIAQLVMHAEYAVMRTSGVSIVGVARSLLGVGVVLAALTFLIGEYVTPFSEEAAQTLRLRQTSSVVAQSFRSGLWVKDSTSFVNVSQILHDATLRGITIYEFDDAYRLQSISKAKEGTYLGGSRWKLKDVVQTKLEANRSSTRKDAHIEWTSVLTPTILSVLLVPAQRMSMTTLYAYIQHLQSNGQDSARYQIALWTKISYPVGVLVMIVLALPFAYMNSRGGGISGKVFGGIMIGLGFHLMNRLFGHLGLLAGWPPLVAAVLPTLLFLGAGLGIIQLFERR